MEKNAHVQKGMQGGPSAPPSDEFFPNAPPPSYEESQKMSNYQAQPAVVPGPVYHPHYQQPYRHQYPQIQQQYHQQTSQVYHQQNLYGQPAASTSYAAIPISSSSQIPVNMPVLNFAKGARVTTTSNGAVAIPPPPPGCAPSKEQLAAMQGQAVVVKTQKRSFFS